MGAPKSSQGILMDGPGRAPPNASAHYRAMLERLYALSRTGMTLGLERIARILSQLGHPERAFPSVHVAGSNGKGSTCAFLAAMLSAHGRRTGLYTSPHLISLTERVQILASGEQTEISPRELEASVEAVEAVAPGFGDLSFFEVVTAAGLLAMSKRGIDAGVIEAGLGARYDATRLVDASVAVLTDLSLEHTAILGDTIEAIAREEGAVVRSGCPLVSADGPPGAMLVIDALARESEAGLIRIGEQIHVRREQDGTFTFDLHDHRVLRGVQLSLRGPHQGRNALLAIEAATFFDPSITEEAIRKGLASASWPGRLETFRRDGQPAVLLDGAQNAHAAETLAKALEVHRAEFAGPIHFVFGVLTDKDADAMLQALLPLATSIVLTEPSSPRARAARELRSLLPKAKQVIAEVIESPREAYSRALARAAEEGGWVVVCGSLYLVGDIRAILIGE